jgi:hypothetical protein
MFLNKIIIIIISVICLVLSTTLAMIPTCRAVMKRSSSSSCYNHGGIISHKLQSNINIDVESSLNYHSNDWIQLIMQPIYCSSSRSKYAYLPVKLWSDKVDRHDEDDDDDDDVSIFRSTNALSLNAMMKAEGSEIVVSQKHVHRWEMTPCLYLPSQEVCSYRKEGCSDDSCSDKHRTTVLSIISLIRTEAFKSLSTSIQSFHPPSSSQISSSSISSWLSLLFPFFITTKLHAIIASSSSPLFAYKKENLPEKICVVCKRPFTWRKKWRKDWDEVKYCSQRCRMAKSDIAK